MASLYCKISHEGILTVKNPSSLTYKIDEYTFNVILSEGLVIEPLSPLGFSQPFFLSERDSYKFPILVNKVINAVQAFAEKSMGPDALSSFSCLANISRDNLGIINVTIISRKFEVINPQYGVTNSVSRTALKVNSYLFKSAPSSHVPH